MRGVIQRRLLAACCLPILPLSCQMAQQGDPSTAPRPNLIVVLADDLGAEALGCYGGETYSTPNLDRLAAQGVLCANAFTQPLCTPTRVELLTGRSNARNYVSFSVLDPDELTFAEALESSGYRTYAVGKWQLYGADHYGESLRGQGTLPADAGFQHHALWQVESLGKRHWSPTMTIDGHTSRLDEGTYGPDVALEHALSWIGESTEQPFLLFWPMILPHGPFVPPPGTPGPRDAKSDPTHFAPMVEYLDQLMGDLVTHLEENDLTRNTWVLFIGDNGSPNETQAIRDGKLVAGGKKLTTDAGSRVPFLLWAPGRLEAGVRISDPVSTIDVFATLLEIAGESLPDDRQLDGWSLLPRLDGRTSCHRDWVTFHHQPRPISRPAVPAVRWARDARWQLFEDGRLYDTAADPDLELALEPGDDDSERALAREQLRTALQTLPIPDTD